MATCTLKKWQEQLGIKANKLQNDCPVRWNSTFDMFERLFEQRIPAICPDGWNGHKAKCPEITDDESVTVGTGGTADSHATTLAKATKVMCGKLHVGLSFI